MQGSVAGWNPDSRTEIDEAIALPIDEDSENDDNDSNNLVSATAQPIITERESIDMTSEKEPIPTSYTEPFLGMKPFTRSALSNVFNEILSNYEKCSKKFQMIICEMTVNLSKLSITEG